MSLFGDSFELDRCAVADSILRDDSIIGNILKITVINSILNIVDTVFVKSYLNTLIISDGTSAMITDIDYIRLIAECAFSGRYYSCEIIFTEIAFCYSNLVIFVLINSVMNSPVIICQSNLECN